MDRRGSGWVGKWKLRTESAVGSVTPDRVCLLSVVQQIIPKFIGLKQTLSYHFCGIGIRK